MTRYMVLPYTPGSEGATAIADALDGLCIRLTGSAYTYQEGDCVINWGNGDGHPRLINLPAGVLLNPSVNICIDKKAFFERMQGHNIVPPFALTKAEALRHMQFPIICRTRTEGADGAGIVIAEDEAHMASARLYTQLLEHTAEYRVHMGRRFDGEIVLICAQKKRAGAEHPDPRIMTGEHVFLDWCDPANLPRPVFDVTKRSMELMPELHFGGFDVIVTENWGARVVEVNSAPMQTETTARKYAEFFKEYVAARDFRPPEPEVVETPAILAPVADLDNRVREVNDRIVLGQLALRDVIVGYINFCDRAPPA